MGHRASPRALGWLLAIRVGSLCVGVVTIGVLVSGIVLASAMPAAAHAALVSSQPAAGSELATTPGVVKVSFSEPLIMELSTVQVIDPLGDVWERSSVDERSMSVQLDTTASGVYVVDWKTVSPIDGHTLRGSFEFGVGVSVDHPDGMAATQPSRGDVVSPSPARLSTRRCCSLSARSSWDASAHRGRPRVRWPAGCARHCSSRSLQASQWSSARRFSPRAWFR